MLRFKINRNEAQGYDELEISEVFMSEDRTFISGITSPTYGLVDGQNIMVNYYNSDDMKKATLKVQNVVRQGYVAIYQDFVVKEMSDAVNTDNEKYYYILFVDNKPYVTKTNGGLPQTIVVQGHEYDVIDGKVSIPIKYWVEDNKFTYCEYEYDVDFDFTYNKDTNEWEYSNGAPTIEIVGGVQVTVKDGEKKNWKNITKFQIFKGQDLSLPIDFVSYAKEIQYYEQFQEQEKELGDSATILSSENIRININDVQDLRKIGNSVVEIDNVKYQLKKEWVNSLSEGSRLHIFVKSNPSVIYEGQKIIVTSNSQIPTAYNLDGDEKTILFDGVEYEIEWDNKLDYVVIGVDKYFLNYLDDTKKIAMINYGDEIVNFDVNEDEAIPHYETDYTSLNKEKFTVKHYPYCKIKGENYLIKEAEKYHNSDSGRTTNFFILEINRQREVNLIVESATNNSMLRCYIENLVDDASACSMIVNNYNDLNFDLYNELIPSQYSNVESYVSVYSDEMVNEVRIFNPMTYVEIPLLLGNDMCTNANQADILENGFYADEIKKTINPIVDMERDIYVPVKKGTRDDDFSLLNTIKFDLHFRTRDLDTWKIDGTSSQSWNIVDGYKDGGNEKLKIDDYHQYGDLAYFFNFSNDDIFYQKSKISKSFLRLLFYDTNDPQNQSLLHMSTIWLDEGSLYKKYLLNNKVEPPIFKAYDKYADTDSAPSNMLGVNMEPYELNNNNDYEEKRLGCTFVVKNRYETTESSEGFYINMFKEYSEGLRPKTIYMKVEFNHAGFGRTMNFLIPTETKDDGTIQLVQNAYKNPEFQKGYDLDTIYNHLYIPLKLKYSESMGKYVYWFDKPYDNLYINNQELRFNLYELKIKNEE